MATSFIRYNTSHPDDCSDPSTTTTQTMLPQMHNFRFFGITTILIILSALLLFPPSGMSQIPQNAHRGTVFSPNVGVSGNAIPTTLTTGNGQVPITPTQIPGQVTGTPSRPFLMMCGNPDTVAPVLLNVPANDTLNCSDTIPASPVTVFDECPGAQLFESISVSSYECSPGLVSWWPAEGNANDAQGSLNASLINGTTFASALAGDGFALDGVDDYILANDTVNFRGNYTVAFWINTSNNQDQTIFSASDTANGDPGILLRMNAAGQVSLLNRFPTGTSGGTTIQSVGSFNDGNWHQVVATKSDTTLRIRVDNNIVATGSDTNQFNEPLIVTVGRLSYVNNSGNEYFEGGIDEVRVYSKAVCAPTLQALYLAGVQNGTWAPTFRLTRIWTALDASGNASQASQVLVFDDIVPPTLTVPPPLTLNCRGNGGVRFTNSQVQNWANQATGEDDCSCVVVTFTGPTILPSICQGVSFNVINFTVTDECGNMTSGTSTITVVDTSGPNMTCPDVTVVADPATCGAEVIYNLSISDDCNSGLFVDYSIPDSSFFNLGTTQVTVTASDSCVNTSQCSFDVNVVPAPLNIVLESPTVACGFNLSCPSDQDASITSTISGGCLPYQYSWSNGATTTDISGLSAGTYDLSIIDANNDTASASLTVTEPAPLTATSAVTDAGCGGTPPGSIDLTVTGGADCFPYQYNWSGPNGFTATSQDINQLVGGIYTVQISDSNGCMTLLTDTVDSPVVPSATIGCCQDTVVEPGQSGTVTVDLTGNGPWTLAYTDGFQTQTVTANTSTFVIASTPAQTTTWSLVSVEADGCVGDICGRATIAVDSGCSAPPPVCPLIINFDEDDQSASLPAGTPVFGQWSSKGVLFSAENNRGGGPDLGIIFDTGNITGTDTDLGTPNAAFGGPGIGAGGAMGAIGENANFLGNVLIIAENDHDANRDGLVDDPDDEARGGTLTVDFNSPVRVDYLDLLDIDETGGTIRTTDVNGATNTINIPNLGENSYQRVPVNGNNLVELEINLVGSGALAEVAYCPANPACEVLDFSAQASGATLPAGTVVDNEFSHRGVQISAINNQTGHPDMALIFDSGNITGNDPDLGTPNAAFSGPGVGVGGGQSQVGQNDRFLGNLLIIAENSTDANMDALVDNPDDEARGGQLRFDFDDPVEIQTITLVDIDEAGGTIEVCDANGAVISTQPIPNRGDNSVQDIQIAVSGARTLKVNLAGSGGIADLDYCVEEPGQCYLATVDSVVEVNGCRTVTLDFIPTPGCTGVDFVDISLPCGTLDTAFTSAGLTVVPISNDPLSGFTGLRVLNPTGQAFTLTYTVCPGNGCFAAFCAPIIGIGADGCVTYQTSGTGGASKLAQNGNGTTDPTPASPKEDLAAGLEIGVYPNPSNGPLNVQFNGAYSPTLTWAVKDLQGRTLVASAHDVYGAEGEFKLELSTISKGVYVLEVNDGSSVAVKKIVLQ